MPMVMARDHVVAMVGKEEGLPGPAKSATIFIERVRQLLKDELAHGWTATRVASDMNILGHPGWNENVVNTFARGHRQTVTLDEGLSLLAVFGSRARWVTQEMETLMGDLVKAAEQRGSRRREGIHV